MQPRVFAGLFPVDADDYPDLREALDKLRLNDAALRFEPESSEAMGFGFRCRLLGMLHMEIVQEQLERVYDANPLITPPNFSSVQLMTVGSILPLTNEAPLPLSTTFQDIRQPTSRTNLLNQPNYDANVHTPYKN